MLFVGSRLWLEPTLIRAVRDDPKNLAVTARKLHVHLDPVLDTVEMRPALDELLACIRPSSVRVHPNNGASSGLAAELSSIEVNAWIDRQGRQRGLSMPAIFISRGTMSGAHSLLECLQRRKGIQCISREDLEEIVNGHGNIATRILEKLAHASSAYEQFSELRWPYMVLMRKAMLDEICGRDVIYSGYSGHLLLPILRHFIRVRIEAPLDLRLTMTMRRLACGEKEAREYITDADEYRVKWARFMYGCDIRDTVLYDLSLNLAHLTMDAACGILECVLGEKDFQADLDSQIREERLHLAAEVEVALVTSPLTQSYEISAEVESDCVRLIGPYLQDPELASVKEVAQSVAGVEEICYAPGYAPKLGIML